MLYGTEVLQLEACEVWVTICIPYLSQIWLHGTHFYIQRDLHFVNMSSLISITNKYVQICSETTKKDNHYTIATPELAWELTHFQVFFSNKITQW